MKFFKVDQSKKMTTNKSVIQIVNKKQTKNPLQPKSCPFFGTFILKLKKLQYNEENKVWYEDTLNNTNNVDD